MTVMISPARVSNMLDADEFISSTCRLNAVLLTTAMTPIPKENQRKNLNVVNRILGISDSAVRKGIKTKNPLQEWVSSLP